VKCSVLALLLTLVSCVGNPPQAPKPALGSAEPPIRNFARVDEGIYRGAQPDRAGFQALADIGVRTIVCLREFHPDSADDLPPGMRLVEIPMHATLFDSDPPTDDDVRRFFEVILDPAQRPVYVHCAHGKDRTGTMCALYRIEVQGWSPEAAFAEMQEHGFHDMYRDLERFVLEYRPRGLATQLR
jgi:protein tyrosine/serine phosphatase